MKQSLAALVGEETGQVQPPSELGLEQWGESKSSSRQRHSDNLPSKRPGRSQTGVADQRSQTVRGSDSPTSGPSPKERANHGHSAKG